MKLRGGRRQGLKKVLKERFFKATTKSTIVKKRGWGKSRARGKNWDSWIGRYSPSLCIHGKNKGDGSEVREPLIGFSERKG